MDGPQKENGYTAIANEILEAVARTPINATQLKIVLIIWRYTYGFNRKEHRLSETFISKATNIHKKQIQREINDLIKKKIIIIEKEASFTTTRLLSFNKYYDSWEVANKLPGSGLDTHTGSELATSPGSGLDTQERNIKDNIKEIILTPDEQGFLAELEKIENYPFDRKTDLEMYKMFGERYPTVDLLSAVKDWRTHKLGAPIEDKQNPRSQFNTWCKNAAKWGKNPKITKQPNDQPVKPERVIVGGRPYGKYAQFYD
jgi:phage replication O-like protein O